MQWDPKTKPTPANIRKRILAAQEATLGALDLMKSNPRFKTTQYRKLDQAHAWLVDAMRASK